MAEKSIKTNLVLSTFYQILIMILPLVTAPYTARVLGVNGIGIYSYTHSYVLYFTLFGALGMVAYGTREIAQHRDNIEERSQVFWEIAFLTFITSSIAILAWGIWILFNESYRIYYLILSIYLLGTMFDISWFYAGMEEFKYTIVQNSIFKLLGAITIFVFVKKEEDIWIYILILAITTFLANISMWIYLPKFIRMVSLRSLKLKKHFIETLVYFIPTIAISIYTVLDKTLIGIITKDTSENGNYEQATKIINMAKSLCFAGVNIVLSSRISYLFAEKKHDEIIHRISVSMNYILFIGIALGFGLAGIAERFVPFFFGDGYNKTIQLIQYMAPLIVIVGISNCLGYQYFTPAGLRAKSAKFIIVGSVINLIMNIILIPRLRSVGAVIATIIAELTISMLYLHSCDGYYQLKELFRQAWKKIVAGIIMILIIIPCGHHVDSNITSLSLQIILGIITYGVVLFILRDSFLIEIIFPQMKQCWVKMIVGLEKDNEI